MRMIEVTSVKCPGCQLLQPTRKARLPGFMQPAKVIYHCEGCESTVVVTINRPRHRDNIPDGQLKCEATVTEVGPKLKLMMIAAAEEKARKEENGNRPQVVT
jgi:hypothetical protein